MIAILGKLALSVILTLVGLVAIILSVYWMLLILSILTGLVGMHSLSIWLRCKVDSLSARIKRVYETVKGKK